jgi:hypothetical protein
VWLLCCPGVYRRVRASAVMIAVVGSDMEETGGHALEAGGMRSFGYCEPDSLSPDSSGGELVPVTCGGIVRGIQVGGELLQVMPVVDIFSAACEDSNENDAMPSGRVHPVPPTLDAPAVRAIDVRQSCGPLAGAAATRPCQASLRRHRQQSTVLLQRLTGFSKSSRRHHGGGHASARSLGGFGASFAVTLLICPTQTTQTRWLLLCTA